jgi:hypothetical protein
VSSSPLGGADGLGLQRGVGNSDAHLRELRSTAQRRGALRERIPSRGRLSNVVIKAGRARGPGTPTRLEFEKRRYLEPERALLLELVVLREGRFVRCWSSATKPVGSFGSPACSRSFVAISAISSGA